jgi:hypothetical protein
VTDKCSRVTPAATAARRENREEAFHMRPSGIVIVFISQMTSTFFVGEPSMYLVKSTMCWRRFAGHSSALPLGNIDG